MSGRTIHCSENVAQLLAAECRRFTSRTPHRQTSFTDTPPQYSADRLTSIQARTRRQTGLVASFCSRHGTHQRLLPVTIERGHCIARMYSSLFRHATALCPLLQARNHRPSLTEPRPSLSQSTVTDSITATHCHCCRINCYTAGQTERRCDTAHCVDSTAFRLITRNQYTPLCRQINVLSLIRSRYDTRPI